MKAKLILENGMIFEGKSFGYLGESVGEVVFTTGMTGYQEVLTDPSYHGQIVTMTYPLIGNYGINLDDMESNKPQVKGFIVREKCNIPNNFRCEMNLDDYLKQNKIVGIEGIDTRALTKILRNNGTMKGIITLDHSELSEVKKEIEAFSNKDAVSNVTTDNIYEIDGEGKHVAIIDYGIKNNILNCFKKRGCKITVFPSNVTAEEVLNINPDLVFLSNGPGDPEDLEKEILEYRNHIKSTIAFESLDNLVRGGRLSKGKALFVSALGIKLMLNVLDGEMNVQGKIRGTKKMVKAMIEQFDSIPKKEGEPIILVELENEDIYLPIKEYLENNNIEYLKLPLGCSVAIHSGPKVCALFYVEEY